MSDPVHKSDERLAKVEVGISSVATAVESLADSVSVVVEKTDRMTSHVARLEAGAGRVPTATITAIVGVLASVVSVAIGGVVVVGAMALDPVKQSVMELRNDRKTTVEQLLPDLSSVTADLKARVNENEHELERQWDLAFDYLEWKGRVSERIDRMGKLLERRVSEDDGAQNARLSNIEKVLDEVFTSKASP